MFPKLNKVHDSILPKFYPVEASSPDLEDEDVSKETANGEDGTYKAYVVEPKMSAEDDRSIPVLLSEEMLAQLIKASEKEHGLEKDSSKDVTGRVADTDEEIVKIILEFKNDEEQQQQQKEKDLEEEVGSSTDSEIPVDLNYTADSVATETRKIKEIKPLTIKLEKEKKMNNDLPTVMGDYDTWSNQDYDDPNKEPREKAFDQAMAIENLQDEQILIDPETDKGNTDEDKKSMWLPIKKLFEEQEEGKDMNESVSHSKGKRKTRMKSKRLSKAQSDHNMSTEETSTHSQNQGLDAEITLNMMERKRGKWVRHLELNNSNGNYLFVNISIQFHLVSFIYLNSTAPGPPV